MQPMMITAAGPMDPTDYGWETVARLARMAPRTPRLGQMLRGRRGLGQYVEAATTAYSIVQGSKPKKQTHEQRVAARAERVAARQRAAGISPAEWEQLKALANAAGYTSATHRGRAIEAWIAAEGGIAAVREKYGIAIPPSAIGPDGGIMVAGVGGGGLGVIVALAVAGLVVAPLIRRRGRGRGARMRRRRR